MSYPDKSIALLSYETQWSKTTVILEDGLKVLKALNSC